MRTPLAKQGIGRDWISGLVSTSPVTSLCHVLSLAQKLQTPPKNAVIRQIFFSHVYLSCSNGGD